MGRSTFASGMPDCGAGIMDGSPGGLLCQANWPAGIASLGSPAAGPTLPGSVQCRRESPPDQNSQTEQELNQIWLELSASDRQRFGCCFSFMVLKALGLRPCCAQEVEA